MNKKNTSNNKSSAWLTVILSLFAILGISCSSISNSGSSTRPIDFVSTNDMSVVVELQKKNTQHANDLFENLYSEYTVDLANTPDNPDDDLTLGAQRGYYAEPGSEDENDILILYGRTWIYDTGIGLSLAVANDDPTADKRALWLMKNAQYLADVEDPESKIFGGWNFSTNQAHLGDNWKDQRYITGANTFALIGMAEYIASDFYKALDSELQREFSDFYADALSGILYHFELAGPNKGLVTAGWSLNALDEYAITDYSYYEMLDLVGYGADQINGYPKSVERTRSLNVVTEHCNDLLKALNFTVDHYNQLFGFKNAPYSRKEINKMRIMLRESIFTKLFNEEERRVITGRTLDGEPSVFSAIDNASWLALSVDLEDLDADEVQKLSDSLMYTIITFTADFEIDGSTYYGTHYFPDGFKDPYIVESDSYSSAYHIEATCGLICGLLDFVNVFPEHSHSPIYRDVALELWIDLQRYIDKHGFIYASTAEGGTFEPKEASVSAIWYLMTLKYLN